MCLATSECCASTALICKDFDPSPAITDSKCCVQTTDPTTSLPGVCKQGDLCCDDGYVCSGLCAPSAMLHILRTSLTLAFG